MRHTTFTTALVFALLGLAQQSAAQIALNASTSESTVSTAVHMPVELVNFTVTQQGDEAFLKWDIANEVNIEYYEVEVAKGNTEFEPVGKLAAVARNGAKQSYSFNYALKPGMKYFFRLKMMDMSGTYLTSYIRTLNAPSKPFVNITIAPNPVVRTVTLNGMREGNNVITICDATGTRLSAFVTTATEVSIDFSNYLPGIYNLIIQDATGVAATRRISKQ